MSLSGLCDFNGDHSPSYLSYLCDLLLLLEILLNQEWLSDQARAIFQYEDECWMKISLIYAYLHRPDGLYGDIRLYCFDIGPKICHIGVGHLIAI